MGFSLYYVLCVAKQAWCVSPTGCDVHTWTNSGKYSGMKQLEYNGMKQLDCNGIKQQLELLL